MSEGDFRLTPEQHKAAVAYIHWLVADGPNPNLPVYCEDVYEGGVCVYIGKPGEPLAWRFHVQAIGSGQTKV